MTTGKPYTLEYRVRHKDGHYLWLRSRNVVYSGSLQGKTLIYAVIQDITELKALQTDLQTVVEAFSSGVGVFQYTDALHLIRQNARMASLSGCVENSLPASAPLSALLQTHMQSGLSITEHARLLTPDGSEVSVRIFTVSTRDANGVNEYLVAENAPQKTRKFRS